LDGIVVENGGILLIEEWATIKNATTGVIVKSGYRDKSVVGFLKRKSKKERF